MRVIYLFLLFMSLFINSYAQREHKCKHVFVEVEQANIKVEQPELSIGSMIYQPYGWPTGLREGKELVCVKCFHIQRQILDYGKPASGTLTWPQGSVINAGPCYDTLFTIPKGGRLKVKTGPTLGSLGFDTCFFIRSRIIKLDTTGTIMLK